MAIRQLVDCRHLVEMMDGQLRVEQGGVEPGLTQAQTFGLHDPSQVMHAPVAVAPRTLEGMRVLVVAADATERRGLALQTEWWARLQRRQFADALALVQTGQPSTSRASSTGAPPSTALAVSIALRSLRPPTELPIVLIAAAPPGPEEAGAPTAGSCRRR